MSHAFEESLGADRVAGVCRVSGHAGGGVAVQSGIAALKAVSITENTALHGSALFLDRSSAGITPTLPITLNGDVYLADGTFYGSGHDLRVDGALIVAGGVFYAPSFFDLTGVFSHTGGLYHQTRTVNGSIDVAFPKAGGVLLNANGQDLGSTQVVLQAGHPCARPRSPRLARCYTITPTNSSGRDAAVTFYYNGDELGSGMCAGADAYRWDGSMWQGPLALDSEYGASGRACSSAPYSLRVTGVSDFSLFGLLALNRIYLPLVCK